MYNKNLQTAIRNTYLFKGFVKQLEGNSKSINVIIHKKKTYEYLYLSTSSAQIRII